MLYHRERYPLPLGWLTGQPDYSMAFNLEKSMAHQTNTQPLSTIAGVPSVLKKVYLSMPNRNSAQTLDNLGKNPEQRLLLLVGSNLSLLPIAKARGLRERKI
jgi:hypothetical protein